MQGLKCQSTVYVSVRSIAILFQIRDHYVVFLKLRCGSFRSFHFFFSILSFTTLICFLCNLHPFFLPPYNENAYLHIIYLSFCKSIRTEELLLSIAEIDDLADHSVHRNICHLPHISTSCGRYNCWNDATLWTLSLLEYNDCCLRSQWSRRWHRSVRGQKF